MRIGWKAAVHDPAIASFRFRVAEPVAALAARGHDVELFAPERADRYNLVIFCKSYREPDQALARAVRARGGQVALDLCDNHFYNPENLPRYQRARRDLLAMIALADRLIVSTPVLAGAVRQEAGLTALPHVVGDVAERIALPPRPAADARTLLWFGSHGSPNAPAGMEDLLRIAAPLRAQHARTPFELVVASNDEAKFAALAPQLGVPARYVAWTREGFPALLVAADAVVIPLSDNPFVAAKTHNRMTTALWPGVPVVADVIDSYREFAPFAYLADWAEGLRAVLEDGDAARDRAAGARAYIDAHWTMAQLAPAWEAALGLETSALDVSPAISAAPPEPAPAPAVPTPHSGPRQRYQGALDPVTGDRVTGWVRLVAGAPAPAQVALVADDTVLAQATADRPRPDLAAAGFRESGCGFALPVPAAWLDGAPRHFAIRVDDAHILEQATARFYADAATPADAVDRQLRAVADLLPSVRDGRLAQEEVRRQAKLADELEALTEAVEAVRRIAARIVLHAGDGAGDPKA